jgi:hypothetical protein
MIQADKTLKIKLSQDNYTNDNANKYLARAKKEGRDFLQFWYGNEHDPWITLEVKSGAQILSYPHAFGCAKFDDSECDCGYDYDR